MFVVTGCGGDERAVNPKGLAPSLRVGLTDRERRRTHGTRPEGGNGTRGLSGRSLSHPRRTVGPMAGLDQAYTLQERQRAAAWKHSSASLPDEARVPAQYVNKDGVADGMPYDFCLPVDYAPLSLLAEVREPALAVFSELAIPWHAGVGDGPSNHLLSSQVQCVNALGQMVTEPCRLRRAFGGLLDTDEVLQVEPGRYLTFEYIGDADYFHEGAGEPRVRGTHCTSVDAAFLHRTSLGQVELVLVEWKYTESYRRRQPDPARDDVRRGRYETALAAEDGPVRPDLLEFSDLLDEPLYQLMRQQLLAHALESDHAHGADVVRIVHVLPKANVAYQQSLHRASQRALGGTVAEVWGRLLRNPDRFMSIDSALFLDPAITSAEYLARYGDPILYPTAGAR